MGQCSMLFFVNLINLRLILYPTQLVMPRFFLFQQGKQAFGADAQLKNAIGNWSRWLTNLFGIEDDDSIENMNKNENGTDIEVERKELDTSFKAFHLFNALSDLMMLPKDMLLSRSIRKEVMKQLLPKQRSCGLCDLPSLTSSVTNILGIWKVKWCCPLLDLEGLAVCVFLPFKVGLSSLATHPSQVPRVVNWSGNDNGCHC